MQKIIKVEGMMCNGCVNRISQALSKENLEFKVCLEEKTVSVNGCEVSLSKALEAIEGLGFETKVL